MALTLPEARSAGLKVRCSMPLFTNSVEGSGPTPVEDILSEQLNVESSAELLVCLKQWRDEGLCIYMAGQSFSLHPATTILEQSEGNPDELVIGTDLDGDALLLNRHTGILTGGGFQLDLAHALGQFRDAIIRKQIEWADGWIEKSA